MAREPIQPEKVTRPFQLLAAWFATLIALVAAFLTGARLITEPAWIPGLFSIAAVVLIPVFLLSMFLLQTRFRPEMQDDKYYATYLKQRREAEQTRMLHVRTEIAAITAQPSAIDPNAPITAKDLLIVIDVQNDFIDGVLAVAHSRDLIPGINQACRAAHQGQMLVAFTRDWHPTNHCTFKSTGGVHAVHELHCVAGSRGAELHEELFTLVDHIIVDFGTAPDTMGYSPLENGAFRALVSSDRINRIFVTGIAFEYCVQACCLDLRKLGKTVIAIEPLIAKAKSDPAEAQIIWNELEKAGVVRSQDIPSELQTVA